MIMHISFGSYYGVLMAYGGVQDVSSLQQNHLSIAIIEVKIKMLLDFWFYFDFMVCIGGRPIRFTKCLSSIN